MNNSLYIKSVELTEEPERDKYLLGLPIVKYLKSNKIEFKNPVTFVVGENGSGKSTLIEAVAVAYGFNAEGGTKNFNFETNYNVSELSQCIRLCKSGLIGDGFFLRAESFYNFASNIDELDTDNSPIRNTSPHIINSYGGISLHRQSHGESFLSVVQNRLNSKGIYLLDEPEAALSPTRIMTLLVEINRLVKLGSQFIISTHSPILMAYPDADILQLSPDGIDRVKYTETEHYIVTKEFLNNTEKMLDILLE